MKAISFGKLNNPSGPLIHLKRKSLLTILLILAFFLPEHSHVFASPETQRGQKTMRVNSTADTVDVNPGDGVCADSQKMCTLRAAIMEANSTQGGGKILLPGGTYTLVIPGTDEDNAAAGDLDILQSTTIQSIGREQAVVQAGAGAGSGIDRVFHVRGNDPRSPIEVNLQDITIQNGQAPSGLTFPKNSGGGLLIEGYTRTHLKKVNILNNSAPDVLGLGGGIMVCGADCKDQQAGVVSLEDSQVNQNSAAGPGGGIVLANLEEFEMINTSVLDNTSSGAAGGAAIRNIRAVSTIRNTTIARNRSQSGGGLVIEDSKIYLANTTISGNSTDGSGAGLYINNASMVMLHATIANNKSGENGGGIYAQDAEVEIGNSILAGNSADENPDCSGDGDYDSAGYNLIQDPQGCSSEFDEDGDLTGEDPLLAPLANNGGNTLTHALDINSPAAHLIPVEKNGCGSTIKTDQRGKRRPGNFSPARRCEMGAWEAQREDWDEKPTQTSTVTTTATEEATLTPSLTETATETEIPVDTSTATSTATVTETGTATSTATVTETGTSTSTATATATQTATPTMTVTATNTVTATASLTASPTKTRRPQRQTRTPTLTLTSTITRTPTLTATRTPTERPTRTLTPTKKPTRTPTRKPEATLGSTLTSSPTTSSYNPAATWTPAPVFPSATSTTIPATSAYFTAIVRTPTPTLSPPPQGGIRTNTPVAGPSATQAPRESFIRQLFGQPWLLILVAGISGFLGLIVIGLIIWLLFFDKGED